VDLSKGLQIFYPQFEFGYPLKKEERFRLPIASYPNKKCNVLHFDIAYHIVSIEVYKLIFG
jgi:hypothetical protein